MSRSLRRRAAFLLAAVAVLELEAPLRPSAAADDPAAAGQKIFKDQGCPQCHGFGGKGDGYLLKMIKEPVVMRDWTDPAAMQDLSDAYLVEITKRGGEPLGKSKVMLKYGHKLDDAQIQQIVVFIRSLAK